MSGVLAAYSRLSNEDYDKKHNLVDESCSLVHQRQMIHDYLQSHPDLTDMVVVTYSDDGYTGTNFERPQFQQMLAAAHRGEIQCIIVKDFSRLGRNFLEVGDYLDRIFPQLGVRVISIGDQYDSNDYLGTTAGISVAFRNLIYDSYSKDLSIKVRSAMMTHMERAKYVNHPPYGYTKAADDKHQLIPDPETAPIVREIYARVKAGQSTSSVAKELNRRSVPTPIQQKKHKLRASSRGCSLQWSRQAIIRIIQNPKYTGIMINHMKESRYLRDTCQRKTEESEWFIRENAHEALVSREDFELANQQLRHPVGYSRAPGVSQISVFVCGYCGHRLCERGQTEPFFVCETASVRENALCENLRWRKAELEAILLPSYRAHLQMLGELSVAMDQHPANAIAAHMRHMARIEEELASCEKEKLSLYEAYRSGSLDRDAFMEKKHAISDRYTALEKDYNDAAKEYAARKVEAERFNHMKEIIRQQLAADNLPGDKLTRQMYHAIDRVIVKDKEIEIHWAFEDFFKQFQELAHSKKTVS